MRDAGVHQQIFLANIRFLVHTTVDAVPATPCNLQGIPVANETSVMLLFKFAVLVVLFNIRQDESWNVKFPEDEFKAVICTVIVHLKKYEIPADKANELFPTFTKLPAVLVIPICIIAEVETGLETVPSITNSKVAEGISQAEGITGDSTVAFGEKSTTEFDTLETVKTLRPAVKVDESPVDLACMMQVSAEGVIIMPSPATSVFNEAVPDVESRQMPVPPPTFCKVCTPVLAIAISFAPDDNETEIPVPATRVLILAEFATPIDAIGIPVPVFCKFVRASVDISISFASDETEIPVPATTDFNEAVPDVVSRQTPAPVPTFETASTVEPPAFAITISSSLPLKEIETPKPATRVLKTAVPKGVVFL